MRMDMGDSLNNSDIRTSDLAKGLEELGLRDAILSLRAPASPPATQNSNTNRVPIDAIWVTLSVKVTRAGYCPFDGVSTMASNHLMMWVELDNISILGKHLPSSHKDQSQQDQVNGPMSKEYI